MSDYFKKRMEELGLSNTEDSSNKKTNSSNSTNTNSNYFSERMKALGLDSSSSSKVDDSYINSFVKDAQSHFDTKNLTGDISTAYDSWKKRDKELRERESAIRDYLANNKSSMTEESYNSLKSFLDDFGMNSAMFSYSLYDAERKANVNPFDSMTSEDVRSQWDQVKAENAKTEKEYEERRQPLEKELTLLKQMRRAGISREREDRIKELEAELAALDNEYKQPSEIAYTTKDGRNVTWEKLYNNKLADEEFDRLYSEYSTSDDWGKLSQDRTEGLGYKSDFDILFELSHSNAPLFSEDVDDYSDAQYAFQDAETKRKYIEDKYGVDLHDGNAHNTLLDLMNKVGSNDSDNFDYTSYMTEKERSLLNYIFNTQGHDAAAAFHDQREDIYQDRHIDASQKNALNLGKENPWQASIGSVALNLASGIEFIGDTITQAATGERQYNDFGGFAQGLRGGVMEGTDWNIGDFDAFDFLYGTGMSMADSVTSAVLLGGLGGVNLGLSAAGQSYNDAINRGMSADQALRTAMVAGVAEGLFETLSIEKFKALQKSGKAGFKDIALDFAKLSVTNASEETFTEIANIAYDILANGDFSQYETSVRQYMNAGLSEEEARKKAGKDLNAQIIEAGASGALMGFGFGGVNAVAKTAGKAYSTIKGDIQAGKNMISAAEAAENFDSVAALKSLAYEMAGEKKTFADKQLAKTAGKIDYTNLKARQVGKTQRLLSESISKQNVADVKAALVKSGVSEKVASRITNSLAENGLPGLMAEMQKLDLADMTRVEEVIGNIANDPTSSANVRAQRLEAAEQGVYSPDAAPKAIEQATPEALKGEHKVSESGKTLYKNENGEYEEVNTLKIVSTEGDVKVEIDNGKTVSAKDLELSTDAEAMAFEMVTRMETTPETAQVIFEAVKASDATSAQELFLSVPTAYRYGKINYEAGLKGLRIPDAIKKLAFDRGRADAATSPKGETQVANKQTKNANAKQGKVIFEGFEYSDDKATDMQKASMAGINLLTKMSSLEIHVYASWVEDGERYAMVGGKKRKAPNGWHEEGTNKIYIDINAGNYGEGAMLYTLGHEATHYIADWNWDGFKKLGDFLIENFGKHNVPVDILIERKKKTLIKSYQRDGKAVPGENQLFREAYEEVVAEAMTSMFADPKAYDKLAELKKQDKKGWEKLKEAIKKLLDKLKSLLGGYTNTKSMPREAEFVAQFSKDVYDKLQDLYLKAFVEADANYQAAKKDGKAAKKNSKRESNNSYSERDYPIDSDVEKMVKDAFAKPNSSMRELSSITSEQNKAINGLVNQTHDDSYRGKFTGGKHIFSGNAIKHIISEHGDFLREGLRAQLPMNIDDVARHMSAIKDNKKPSTIKAARTKRGTPSILTSYEVNGYTLYAEEITKSLGKNLPSDLIGHTMYKAPTLATAAFYATSAQTQPKRQSMVLCTYYTPNSTDLSRGNFVADSKGAPAMLKYMSLNGVAKQDPRASGLIALSSDESNFTDKVGGVEQGYVRCQKPFYITQDNQVFSNSETDLYARLEELKKQGYDCFIFDKAVGDNYMVAVVNKAQIIKDVPKVVYSERNSADSFDSLFEERTAVQNKLNELRQTKKELEASEEYNKLIEDIASASGLSERTALRNKYNDWAKQSKYNDIADEINSLQKKYTELNKTLQDISEQKAIEEERKKIEKSGLSDADYFRKSAVNEFGYTPYFYDAGYILPDGKMLNFSGEKGKHFGSRGQDHRAIGTIYANVSGGKAMLKFMSEGNIRLMAESPGVDIGIDIEPTISQYNTISRFITDSKKKGYFYVDFTDAKGNVIGTLSYDGRLDNAEIIYDIKDYFKTGKVREQRNSYSERTTYAPTFYSYMGKVVDAIRLEKMGAGGVVSYLKGKGVKDEEIKWSGIEAFLEGKKSVTKAELQEFVAGNQLQIDEEMSGKDIDLRYDGSNRAYNLYDENGNVIDTFTYSEFLDGYVSESDEEIYGSEISLREALREEYEKADSPRWADYRIDGGSNYRELVFKMPNSSYSNQAMRTHWGEYAEGVLAHARIQDMTTSDGKKMLFIEEIQSDWHNEGAKDGYQDAETESKIKRLKEEADIAFYELEDYSTELTGMAGEYEAVAKTQKGRELLRKHYKARDALKDAENAYVKKVPDAPFRDTYHEYVLKRLLRMAAEEGYDSIGWTTADIQSDRWSDEFAEAYRIEYDQEIPKFLRKYGKKWGASVGHTTINDTQVWSMDITDSMKDSVLNEGQVMYSERVTDKDTLDFLNGQIERGEYITVYRSFQVIDGGLYAPMNAVDRDENGKNKRLGYRSELGKWEKATESRAIAQRYMDAHPNAPYAKFDLDGGDNKTGGVAYNPYLHASNLVLNDQFAAAYRRNLVTVECRVPLSEADGTYKADYAKDGTGWANWKAGGVAGQLKKIKPALERRLFLSRYMLPVRILSDAEVAAMYKEYLDGTDIPVSWNVVTPSLRKELEKAGVNISYKDVKQSSGSLKFAEQFPEEASKVHYQERDPDSISNRSLLANALESAAKEGEEKNLLRNYKTKLRLIEAEQAKLADVRQKAYDLRFKKGRTAEETKALKSLDFEAKQIATRINSYDRELLKIEAMKPIKEVLNREKQMAYKRAEQKGKEALKKQRERASENYKKLLAEKQESRKKAIESRKMSEVRGKIKRLKERMESSLLNPTDNNYIPVGLVGAMVDVCSIIDTDTPLYKKDGSLNKAQAKRDATKEKLLALKDEYEKLKTEADPLLKVEFEEEVYEYLKKLYYKFSGKSLSDMSLAELEELYETLRAVQETIRDAKKVIGWGDASDVYAAGDKIAAEQKSIVDKRKKDKRTAAQKANDAVINLSLSPVRNVERMSGYRSDSPMLKLFNDFERGVRKKNMFSMEAHKDFEALSTGKNAKAYEDAIYEGFGNELTDDSGRKFKVSKMQMMQAIMSYEREMANPHMHHLEGSGFTFADLDLLRKGKLGEAISAEHSHRVTLGMAMAQSFSEALKDDQWAQDYMAAARKFFDEKAKNAINDTYITLKHRIIARDKNYIPFEVDKSFVVQEISAEEGIQQTISSYGMLKDKKDGASQPLIITGLNNILERHIDQVGNVYGLAIPVRNFNKVWNVRTIDSGFGGDPTIKGIIETVWGKEGKAFVEQTVKDIQGRRPNAQSAIYRWIKSNYIGATFLLNGSVVLKQVGSLFASTSMLKWRDPASMLANLAYTMAHYKSIAAEVDKYTATVWVRRQGISDGELQTLATEAKQGGIAKLFSKLPAGISPQKWIAAMDSAVALSLWKYAKEDTAKRTGLQGEELMKATAEFFDSVVENTQSMADVLHRPEVQKRSDILSEAVGMFKTDLYQMAGQLQVSLGRFKANKTKENGAALGRTIYSIASSAVWASLMTSLFAALRYKVKQYRDDEDDEITLWSWLEEALSSLLADIAGYIFPLVGSEIAGAIDSIFTGNGSDAVDSIALTAFNDAYNSIIKAAQSIKEGEMPSAETFKDVLVNSLQMLGLPSKNITRTLEAIVLHAKDIANGEFLSFEAGLDKPNAQRLYNAILSGDEERIEKAKRLYKNDDAITSAIRKALRENDPRIKEAAQADFDGDIEEYNRIVNEIIGEGNFSKADILAAVKSERNDLEPDKEEDDSPAADKEVSIYTVEHYFTAIKSGKTSLANAAKDDIIKTAVANGKSLEDAESAFYSSFRKHAKEAYAEGGLTRSEAERMLVNYGNLDGDDAYWTLKEWDYLKQNGTLDGYSKYNNFYEAVRTGKNLKAVISEYTSHGVEAKTLASQITTYFKPIYKEMSNRSSLKGYLLNAYVQLGYSRSEKNKDINAWLKEKD